MELISVIVPVYNVESYVAECIESIQNQTYMNLEIILVMMVLQMLVVIFAISMQPMMSEYRSFTKRMLELVLLVIRG